MLSYGNAQYIYSRNGELQKKIVETDTTSYAYDYFGNLLSVRLPRHGGQADGDFIEYMIDAQNHRIGKKLNGNVIKRWVYAGGLLPIAELDSAIKSFFMCKNIEGHLGRQLIRDVVV